MFNYRKGVDKHRCSEWLIAPLLILLLFMVIVVLKCSKPLECDSVRYTNSNTVCEVYIDER